MLGSSGDHVMRSGGKVFVTFLPDGPGGGPGGCKNHNFCFVYCNTVEILQMVAYVNG